MQIRMIYKICLIVNFLVLNTNILQTGVMLTEVGDAIGEDAGTVYVSEGPDSSWVELCRICMVCNPLLRIFILLNFKR